MFDSIKYPFIRVCDEPNPRCCICVRAKQRSLVGCHVALHCPPPCQDHTEYTYGETAQGVVVSCECDSVQVSDSRCDYGNTRWVLAFFWLLSATWGIAVLKNVVTATATGSVASWWFSPADPSAVRGAFYRATHGSFG